MRNTQGATMEAYDELVAANILGRVPLLLYSCPEACCSKLYEVLGPRKRWVTVPNLF